MKYLSLVGFYEVFTLGLRAISNALTYANTSSTRKHTSLGPAREAFPLSLAPS